MMPASPRISVVVPHYQDLDSLGRCLDALARQTLPREAFEIIVADNASPVGEAAVAQRIAGHARLTLAPQKGAGPARNAGVAASRGDILAFTDCDCVPEPDWLAQGVAALSAWDFVGGRMRVLVDDPARMTGPEAFETVFAFDNEAYVTRKGFTVTANLFCPRALFDAVGGFRVGVSEDLDWCLRARAAGYRIGYAAGAVVGHPARRTWPELRRKWERLNAEAFGLVAGEPGGRGRWFIRAFALPLSALAHTPKVLRSPLLASGRDRLRALAVLYRLRFWRFRHALSLLASDPAPGR
jgi:GT2 family glycosyltransferase